MRPPGGAFEMTASAYATSVSLFSTLLIVSKGIALVKTSKLPNSSGRLYAEPMCVDLHPVPTCFADFDTPTQGVDISPIVEA